MISQDGTPEDADRPSEEPIKAPAPKQSNDDELLEKLRAWEKASRTHSSQWRKEARGWYDMVAGEQWSSEDKSALLEQMRQPITFNRMAPMVDAVLGAEILNRQEVHFIPRQIGAVQVSELFTAANDWSRQECDAEDEESDAFSDTVICGMGWTETAMDYMEDPAGRIIINRVDPLEMGWDPTAKKRNIADRRFQYRKRSYDRDEFKSAFPGKIEQLLASQQQDDQIEPEAHEDFRPADDKYRYEEGFDKDEKKLASVTVTQMQWYETEPGYAVVMGPGSVKSMGKDEFKQVVMQAFQTGQQPPQAMKNTRKVFYELIYAGNVVLKKKRELTCGSFTFNCITGKRDRNKNTWFGIVKAMLDPQRWANKWLSQILHILNTNAKGGLMYEEGAFSNQTKAEQEWARPDSMVSVKPGVLTGGKVQPKPPPPFPAGIEKMLEFAVGSMPQVTGINLELLGLVQRDQPGVLEQQRKRAGYAILAVFFDALRRYHKMQGRVMLHYISDYISDGRLIRIKGQDGTEQYIPLMRQKDAIDYDIVVDEAPMSANQKDQVWGMLTQLLPVLKDANLPPQIWGEFVKYSPLPSSLATKIGNAITQGPPPDQAQLMQRMQALEVAQKEADVEGTKALAAANMAKAGATQVQAAADYNAAMAEFMKPGEAPEQINPAEETRQNMLAHAQATAQHSAAALNMAKARQAHTAAAMAPMQAAHDAQIAQQQVDAARMKAQQGPPAQSQ